MRNKHSVIPEIEIDLPILFSVQINVRQSLHRKDWFGCLMRWIKLELSPFAKCMLLELLKDAQLTRQNLMAPKWKSNWFNCQICMRWCFLRITKQFMFILSSFVDFDSGYFEETTSIMKQKFHYQIQLHNKYIKWFSLSLLIISEKGLHFYDWFTDWLIFNVLSTLSSLFFFQKNIFRL